jgi:hypothetical protein
MPVVLIHQMQLSEEQYDQLTRRLNPAGLNSASDWPVPGLISHVAGTMPDGTFCVVDVWESEDAVEQFGQKLMPTFAEVGVNNPPPPTVFPAYKHVT